MQKLMSVLLICKIGYICSDAVSGLKLLEAGFKKEHLALTVTFITYYRSLLTSHSKLFSAITQLNGAQVHVLCGPISTEYVAKSCLLLSVCSLSQHAPKTVSQPPTSFWSLLPESVPHSWATFNSSASVVSLVKYRIPLSVSIV